MKLNVKALCLASGILWGFVMLITNALYAIYPGYAYEFLSVASSIYPGYFPGGLAGVILGTLYGLVDGAIAGLLLGWLYNIFVGK
jgi:ABC-type phosphate transport system permease subunit